MISRTTALALLLGAALATPAIAAVATNSISGQRGDPTSGDATRAAPLNLPDLKAKPTPKVDADTMNRDIGFVNSLDDIGTVTLSRDGSVTQTPASEGLRAIFEAEIAGKQ
jgi:hypothetical protein